MHYRDPDLQDPVYKRELACIEVAKNATLAAGGNIEPTFAPKRSFFSGIFGGSKTSYPAYQVPTVKTIFWLWQKYRPTPWGDEDSQRTLEAWIRILYGEALVKNADLSGLIAEVNANYIRGYADAYRAGYFVTIKERWQQVVEQLSNQLPPYDLR